MAIDRLTPHTMALGDYLEKRAINPEIDINVPDGYACVRTHLGPYNIIGWVDRKRLARLMQATSSAAYFGYEYIYDPDKEGVEGVNYFIISKLGKKVERAFETVAKELHENNGRQPGEAVYKDNPDSPSYDTLAALIALIGDDEILSKELVRAKTLRSFQGL